MYEYNISAELSAFFVFHSVGGVAESGIWKASPKTSDISKLKQWMKGIPKNNEK